MPRTVIRHTLSALAAVALLYGFAGSALSAQWYEEAYAYYNAVQSGAKSKTPNVLATKKGSQQTGAVLPHPIRGHAMSMSNSR